MRYIEKAKRNEALLFPEYLDDYVELMWLTGKLMPDFRTLSTTSEKALFGRPGGGR